MKKFRNAEAAAQYVDSLPLSALRSLAIELLTEDTNPVKRIPISEEMFNQHFRLIGTDNRGRPRKESQL